MYIYNIYIYVYIYIYNIWEAITHRYHKGQFRPDLKTQQ